MFLVRKMVRCLLSKEAQLAQKSLSNQQFSVGQRCKFARTNEPNVMHLREFEKLLNLYCEGLLKQTV